MARFYIITGERSGDNLGAFVGKELLNQGHEVAGWGGSKMGTAGITIDQDISALNIMGWWDVVRQLFKLRALLHQCQNDIDNFNPDTLILIDFGSFNLRIAKWAKARHMRVVYYSPPKIWATRPGRIKWLQQYCDEIIVLFPFERDYYKRHNLSVHYYGHPLANFIQSFKPDPTFKERYGLEHREILAILPGSRESEVRHTLPIFLSAANSLPQYVPCVSSAAGMKKNIFKKEEDGSDYTVVDEHDYYNLLAYADQAFITSGTATLEASLFKLPHIIGYKTNQLNYEIAKRLIRTPYIGLPNLIAGKELVPELIQHELNTQNLTKNLILQCRPYAKSILANEFTGIINEITLDNCLFNTIVTITGEKA